MFAIQYMTDTSCILQHLFIFLFLNMIQDVSIIQHDFRITRGLSPLNEHTLVKRHLLYGNS